MHHSEAFQKLVNDAKSRIRQCTADEVMNKMERKEPFHLIDVREESEWEAGYIRGATHVGKGIIERDIEKRVPDKSAEVILYCGGGYRSALAAEALQKMGFENVISMDGGWRTWNEKNYPIED